MTAKEILNKIKAVFSEQPLKAASDVATWNVDGGDPVYVDISDDGISDIDNGDQVYADPVLTVPYPDGTFTVSGSTFSFTCANGVVTATTGTLSPTAPADPAEPPAMAKATPPPATLPAPLFEAMQKKVTDQEAEIISLKAELAQAKTLADKHEKLFPDLFNLIEKLTELPVAEPKTLTGRRQEIFNRQNTKETKLARLAENLKKLKTEAHKN